MSAWSAHLRTAPSTSGQITSKAPARWASQRVSHTRGRSTTSLNVSSAGSPAAQTQKESGGGIGHGILDVLGVAPVFGIPADIVNGIWYAFEGNWGAALLSGAGIIPFAGDALTTLRLGRTTYRTGSNIADTATRSADELVDLVSTTRRDHILDGEARPNGAFGGGHRSGTGYPGKSEFPAEWSDDRIMHEISDIVTDPSLAWRGGNRPGDFFVNGNRGGVDIEVLIRNNQIWTAYPTNVPRNP